MTPEPLRILILEDVPMDAELVEYELERARIPFSSRRVDTREDFVHELENFEPDLILSDYTLPRFDGMAALSLARERVPTVPFLIVTGSVNEETAVGCMKAGATDYLLKSNLARIGPAIESALARVQSRREKTVAQDALRRSEANLRAIFNNSVQCFVLIDRDGTIQALNRTAVEWGERILGRRFQEGDRIYDFIPDAAEGFQAALGGQTRQVQRCIRDSTGVERWFDTTHAPVVDDQGAVIGVCLNAQEVTERKRGEQALRESEARYRDLFDNASDLVCTTAPDGSFLYVNRAWHDSMGYTDADLSGRRFVELVHPESQERYLQVVTRVLAGESLNHVELVLVTSSGATVTAEGNLSATRVAGLPVTLRGIYRDVTERKRIEEQLLRAERMQAAGRLAGGVAHEVNNMMTGVIGFSEFVLHSLPPSDPRRAEVQEIIKAGSRAADVTRQLLAFTRQQLLRPEVLELNEALRGLEKLLRRSLGEDHRLDFQLSAEPARVQADRGQLEQVLVNLMLNARDAMTGPGQVTISIERVSLDQAYIQRHEEAPIEPGEYIRLIVSDTGCGMTPEVQAKIFEPFFTTKPVGQGTGLGLSTVYGIVKQSGGFIWVYSEIGYGTAFKIYLPRLTVGESTPSPPDGIAPPARGSETILVVEDEEMVRALACRSLREHGYTVLEARHGFEAIQQVELHRHSIQLIISDVVMPQLGGRELGQRLAQITPAIPVLYMSGYTGEDVIQRGLLDPEATFQQKPFTPEGLARKVREMLDSRARPGSA